MSNSVRPIRRRATFSQFKTASRRGSAGPVRVRFLDRAPDGLPAVAYAVGRHCGGAVTRNRIRRRLRAAVRQLATEALPPGSYLVFADAEAAALPFGDLVACLERAVRAATGPLTGGSAR